MAHHRPRRPGSAQVKREKVHLLVLVSSRAEPRVWLKPRRDELLSTSEVTGQCPISIPAVLSDKVTHISSCLITRVQGMRNRQHLYSDSIPYILGGLAQGIRRTQWSDKMNPTSSDGRSINSCILGNLNQQFICSQRSGAGTHILRVDLTL